MNIDFPYLSLPKVTAMGTVSFQVRIDGEFLWCEISFEALQNNFGKIPMYGNDLLRAFYFGKNEIEEMAEKILMENGGHAVLLMNVDFQKIN